MQNSSTNTSTPRLSVIMPTFNCLAYVEATIACVFAQQVVDLELIAVDDGSTDGTLERLQQLAEVEARLRVFRQQNGGPAAARNRGISASCAPLVAFIDADDRWHPGKLQAQLALHERHPRLAMSFTDYRHVDEAGNDLGTCFDYWPRFASKRHEDFCPAGRASAVSAIFSENVVGTSTVMASRAALQNANGFDESLRSAQDWELWIRLALSAPVAWIDEVHCDYLMRPGSVTGNLPLRLECMERIIRRHEAAVCAVDAAAFRHAIARLNTGWAECHRRDGQRMRALLRQSLAAVQAPSSRSLRAAASRARDVVRALKLPTATRRGVFTAVR